MSKPKPATKEEIEGLFLFKAPHHDEPRSGYTDTYTMDCPACNAPAEGEGVFCNETGELLKNNFVQCTKCDWNQAS
jgi:hypothetical protein